MVYDFKYLRPYPPKYPLYPPYSNIEDYIEHYFFDFYKKNIEKFEKIDYQYLPIFWTTLYNDNIHVNTADYLKALDQSKKYFTIIQHDDGVRYNLPENTIVFSASENGYGKICNIPLLTSPLPDNGDILDKDIFCSFVGTITHPVRKKLYDLYSGQENFYFSEMKNWSPVITNDKFEEFKNITKRSKFSLCPRGNIIQSFRIYEILQLNSVPVIISDRFTYPFGDLINWKDFSIIINDPKELESKLSSISDEYYDTLLVNGKEIYNEYFTLEKMCLNIYNILKCKN